MFQSILNELIVFIAVATTAPRLSSSHVPRLSLIMLHPRVPPKGRGIIRTYLSQMQIYRLAI
jgi:hypothetical protein